jgi:hypothetical protein
MLLHVVVETGYGWGFVCQSYNLERAYQWLAELGQTFTACRFEVYDYDVNPNFYNPTGPEKWIRGRRLHRLSPELTEDKRNWKRDGF